MWPLAIFLALVVGFYWFAFMATIWWCFNALMAFWAGHYIRAAIWGCLGVGMMGQFRAPLQLHRGLDRLDALASRSNGLTERSPEPLIGFDQLRVLIRRGNRRL
jgi:hypothetical protein